MRDEQCVQFLRWVLPQLHMRWPGFRKVRKQVCKRIDRRIRDLGLAGVEEYEAYLKEHPDEWLQLDSLCQITVSRFYRDQGVFASLSQEVLPALVQGMRRRGDSTLRIWSAGCGSGEEPYTLAVLWAMELASRFSGVSFKIVATDVNANVLRRARSACYKSGSLRELPESWRRRVFTPKDDTYLLKPEYRCNVEFAEQDIRQEQPRGRFDLVLCRNLVFTYFEDALQLRLLKRIVGAMHDGAALVLGVHETLPEGAEGLSAWFEKQRIYRNNGKCANCSLTT